MENKNFEFILSEPLFNKEKTVSQSEVMQCIAEKSMDITDSEEVETAQCSLFMFCKVMSEFYNHFFVENDKEVK